MPADVYRPGVRKWKKTFELWLHDIYQNCGYRAQQRIGRKFDAMNSNFVDEIDSNVVISMLKNVSYDAAAQRYL